MVRLKKKLRIFWPEGVRGDKIKPTQGREKGGKFGQYNGSTEGQCFVNMTFCYKN
jgi:hypothetical protein